jgi:F-type H+-transporting ATPase subunit epsilon
MAQTFSCTLVTPEEQMLDEQVTYASIPAHDGLIGLEPKRAPLLVKLGDGVLRLDFEEGGSRWFYIGGGFAQMKDDKLSLLADQAIAAEDINRQDTEAELAEANVLVTKDADKTDAKTRDITRAKLKLGLIDRLGNKV